MSGWVSSITATLTADEARSLTDQIAKKIAGLVPLVKRAYEGRADKALGYASWHAYCEAELGGIRIPLADRPAAVAELRGAGMSTRAIGSAIGVDPKTVRNDLSAAGATGEHSPVETIRSLDGRERPASMPARPAEPDRLWMSIRRKGLNHHLVPAGADKTVCDRFVGAHAEGQWGNGVIVNEATVAELESQRCPQCWPTEARMPAGQDVADTILAEIDRRTAAPSTSSGQEMTAEERDAAEDRKRAIANAKRTARTLVNSVLTDVNTLLAARELGLTDLITPQMIVSLRRAVDMLEGELHAAHFDVPRAA